MTELNKPELLIPAGNLEKLKTAVRYGADAVYVGASAFGLRAKAKNFSFQQLAEGIDYAHQHDVKVYLTANIIAHNDDIKAATHFFEEINEIKPDAVIVADPGMLMLAKQKLSGIDFHLSTQANNTNYATLNFWYEQGVRRVVLARELSLAEIIDIRMKIPIDMEVEAFVHGAMCMAYSGRCLLSNYMTGQDANHGACTQSCRWKYHVVEETRPNQYMPVVENERGTFIYNSKDLCMIEHLDDLIPAGISSLKIEGRMKTELYVATVTRAYRRAIDEFMADKEAYRRQRGRYLAEVSACSHRQFSTGFYYHKPTEEGQIYTDSSYIRERQFIAKVLDYDECSGLTLIEQRNKFVEGEQVEVLTIDGDSFDWQVSPLKRLSGEIVNTAPHAKERLWVTLPVQLEIGTIICKRIDVQKNEGDNGDA